MDHVVRANQQSETREDLPKQRGLGGGVRTVSLAMEREKEDQFHWANDGDGLQKL